MDVKVLIGARYAVTTDSACSVVDKLTGKPLCTASVGKQGEFVAISDEVVADDESVTVTQIHGQLINVYSTSTSGSSTGDGSGGSGSGEWTDIRPLSNTWTGTNSFNGMVRFASGIDCMGAAYIRADLHKTIDSKTLTSTSVLNMGEADARYASMSHQQNHDMHVTAEDKARWNAAGSGSGTGGGSANVNITSRAVKIGENIGPADVQRSVIIGNKASVPSSSDWSQSYIVAIGEEVEGEAGSTVVGYKAESGSDCAVIGNLANGDEYAVAVGDNACGGHWWSTAVGYYAAATGVSSVALGNHTAAPGAAAIAIGEKAAASGAGSVAIGPFAVNSNQGCTVLSAVGNPNWSECSLFDYAQPRTQLYLIGAGSPLANEYCGGEAALGFVVTANDGKTIVHSGTKKLIDLLTDNKNTFKPSMTKEAN